jgi:hypothetical protein
MAASNINGVAIAGLSAINGASSISAINGLSSTIGGGGFAYEFLETFEGSTVDDQSNVGYDNSGWASYQPGLANTPHYATSPAPLAGTYSFRAASEELANISRTAGFTASGTFSVYFMMNVPTVWNEAHVIWLRNSSDVVVLALHIDATDGKFQIGDHQLINTGVTADATGYSLATTYHIWLEYIKGTGANGQGKLYISTTSTKPGSPTASFNTGTATTDAAQILVFGGASGTIIDRLIADGTQTIGSTP